MAKKIEQLPAALTGVTEPLSVAGALHPRRINLNLAATDKDGVLRELVALIVAPQEKRPFEMLFKALKAREDLCPTCLNEGVAIPHSRNALVGLVDQPTLAYGRHRVGVDFGALDGQPVRHFFLLCAPNVRDHLQLLARLSRLVSQSAFRAKLVEAATAEQVIDLLQDAESKLS